MIPLPRAKRETPATQTEHVHAPDLDTRCSGYGNAFHVVSKIYMASRSQCIFTYVHGSGITSGKCSVFAAISVKRKKVHLAEARLKQQM